MSNHPFKPLSFTIAADRLLRVLISPIAISAAFDPRTTPHPPAPVEFRAIWDTGATNCIITSNVVQKCGLRPIGMAQVNTSGGSFVKEVFLINFFLPNRVGFSRMRATLGDIAGADMLVGMDVLCRGDFAVTNHDGKTVFTFRMPSCERLDFVQTKSPPLVKQVVKTGPIQARNSKCACGSGLKYKRCCGRTG